MSGRNKKKTQKIELDPGKKRIFKIIMLSIPILFFILLEVCLRLFNYGGDTRLFISGTGNISQYWMCNPQVAKRYFFMQETIPNPSKDLFLKKKPENGYRIFVLGGSTTAGFPYANNLTFPRILNKRLSDAFPGRTIEVVNTAMAAVNSYTLVDFMDEILAKEPDALLIYAGHNEFYGAMGVASMESLGKIPAVVNSYMTLKKLKTFVMVRDFVGLLRKATSKALDQAPAVNPTATLMERIVADQEIPLNSPLYNLGKQQFTNNLDAILSKASKAGVPVIIGELVSNIRDQAPFESVSQDSFPRAETMYAEAKKLDNIKEFDQAREKYYFAKDLDALRFRAAADFNTIIHVEAEKYKADVEPFVQNFENNSPDGIPGKNLFVEHLHPNINGYFLLADGFFNKMRENNFIAANWDSNRIPPSSFYQKTWGKTPLDSACAAVKVLYLKGGWPFKPKSTPNHAFDNFIPKTIIDTLAVRVLVDRKFSVESAHLFLGEYYEVHEQPQLAFNEYIALIYTIPWEMDFYERAAKILMKNKNMERAFGILLESQKYGNSAFANKWIGQILLSKSLFNEAIPYLEMALQLDPNDEQTKTNLNSAKAILANQEQEPQKQVPVADVKDEQNQTRELIKNNDEKIKQISQEALIGEAQKQLLAKEYTRALVLLNKSLEYGDSFTAHKWIGMIRLKGGEFTQAIEEFNKADAINANEFETLYNLCNAYILDNNKLKAQEVYTRLGKIRPGFNDPLKLKEKIAAIK